MTERRLALGLLLLLAAGWSGMTQARDIKIETVSSRIENGRYVVDAQLAVELNDSTREALENGVELEFDLDVLLLRPRRLWWDAELLRATRRFVLSRHALADGYLLSEPAAERQRTFKNVEEALRALGDVDGFVAGRLADDARFDTLRGRLRMRLDIEALPAPLRPVAYVSPSWRISSGWHDWTFER